VNSRTESLLDPAPITATATHLVGKESRRLGLGRGTLSTSEHQDYGGSDVTSDVIDALSQLTHDRELRQSFAAELGISMRWLDEIRTRRRGPGPQTFQRLLALTARRAAEGLRARDSMISLARTEAGVIAQYLELHPPPPRQCRNCGRFVEGRRLYWCSERCRKEFERKNTEQLSLMGTAEASVDAPTGRGRRP
jgi:hypothetical protein